MCCNLVMVSSHGSAKATKSHYKSASVDLESNTHGREDKREVVYIIHLTSPFMMFLFMFFFKICCNLQKLNIQSLSHNHQPWVH